MFDHPHPQLDRFQFWELIIIWLCLRGEAFIYPVESSSSSSSTSRSSRSFVQGLLVLCPDHLHEIVRNGIRAILQPEEDIVVYCHHGIRSAAVADYLRGLGFAKAVNLTGGLDLWARAVDPSMKRY